MSNWALIIIRCLLSKINICWGLLNIYKKVAFFIWLSLFFLKLPVYEQGETEKCDQHGLFKFYCLLILNFFKNMHSLPFTRNIKKSKKQNIYGRSNWQKVAFFGCIWCPGYTAQSLTRLINKYIKNCFGVVYGALCSSVGGGPLRILKYVNIEGKVI